MSIQKEYLNLIFILLMIYTGEPHEFKENNSMWINIDDLYKEGPNKFEPARRKELFAKMKEELSQNPNLREGHLAAMCKIYASKTNTPEQKAEYFEQLHQIRKSGKTNAEKREMAATFDRVLGRNPELAKDEALKGLAKVDYSAIGYTPTKRGFSKNDGGRTEK